MNKQNPRTRNRRSLSTNGSNGDVSMSKKNTPTSFAELNRGNTKESADKNTIQGAEYMSLDNSSNLNNCLKAALKYAEMGWPVFPCHSIMSGKCSCKKPDCKSPGKHPRTKQGSKDASTDEAQIKEWWSQWPEANVAVCTGLEAGLAVLDVDLKTDGPANLERLESEFGNIPPTLIAQTGGGGSHYFFKYPKVEFKNSASDIGKGIDTRGDGGYVLIDPSNHISGGGYSWKGSKPGDIELAEMPEWILQKMTDKKKKSAKKGSGKTNEGGRNIFLASEAGKLLILSCLGKGYSPSVDTT